MKKTFIFVFFLLSCSHWLIETKTRIQVENLTKYVINDLCIVSESGGQIVLVPGSIEIGKKSKVYEKELVGEFTFGVSVEDNWKPLGIHNLKGGKVLAQITENKDGTFAMELEH